MDNLDLKTIKLDGKSYEDSFYYYVGYEVPFPIKSL